MSSDNLRSVTNFLVPATGSTNALMVRETFTAAGYLQQFNSLGLDGIPFRPSGIIADNTAGAGPLVVRINEMSFAITIPAGQAIQMPYPAPLNHTATITGDGLATVVFVDYPVFPFILTGSAGGGGDIPNPLPVTGPLTDDELRAAPLAVSTGGLTNAELRAVPVPVSSTALTDAQLRAAAVPVSLPAGTNTPGLLSTSAAGTVAAGAYMISVKNIGAAAGSVAGVALPPSEAITWEAPVGRTLGALAYSGVGTTLLIATTV